MVSIKLWQRSVLWPEYCLWVWCVSYFYYPTILMSLHYNAIVFISLQEGNIATGILPSPHPSLSSLPVGSKVWILMKTLCENMGPAPNNVTATNNCIVLFCELKTHITIHNFIEMAVKIASYCIVPPEVWFRMTDLPGWPVLGLSFRAATPWGRWPLL